MPLEGDAEVSARDALMGALWDNYTVAQKNAFIDAFAHELAEKIRTGLPADPGGKYLTGSMDEAAELIDPETKDAP